MRAGALCRLYALEWQRDEERMPHEPAPLLEKNLPRTVELERDGDGRPRLAYIDQRRLPGELAFDRTGDWRR